MEESREWRPYMEVPLASNCIHPSLGASISYVYGSAIQIVVPNVDQFILIEFSWSATYRHHKLFYNFIILTVSRRIHDVSRFLEN